MSIGHAQLRHPTSAEGSATDAHTFRVSQIALPQTISDLARSNPNLFQVS